MLDSEEWPSNTPGVRVSDTWVGGNETRRFDAILDLGKTTINQGTIRGSGAQRSEDSRSAR